MKAIRYHVIRNTDIDALSVEVNNYLKSEWQPSGGLITTVITNTQNTQYKDSYVIEYAQAMVLYERATS